MLKVDTRGRSCPEPVLLTQKSLKAGENEIEILVDNSTALQNVTKFLKNSGFDKISTELIGEDTLIKARK